MQDDARIVLCRVCNRHLCDYPCNKIHLMSEIIAEAQLEAVERHMRYQLEDDELGLKRIRGYVPSAVAYLAQLRKAAGR